MNGKGVSLGHSEDTNLPIVIRDNSNNQQEKMAIQIIVFHIFKNLKSMELFSNMLWLLTYSPHPASISIVTLSLLSHSDWSFTT